MNKNFFSDLTNVCKLPDIKNSEKIIFVIKHTNKLNGHGTSLGKFMANYFGKTLKNIPVSTNELNCFSNDIAFNSQTLQNISKGFNNKNPNIVDMKYIFDTITDAEIIVSTIAEYAVNGINIFSLNNDEMLQKIVSYCTDNLIEFNEDNKINNLSGICILVKDSNITCVPVTGAVNGYC